MIETVRNVFDTFTVDTNFSENALIKFVQILPGIIMHLNSVLGMILSSMFLAVERSSIADKCIAVIAFLLSLSSSIKLYVFKSWKNEVGNFFDSFNEIARDKGFVESLRVVKLYYCLFAITVILWNVFPVLNGEGGLPTPFWLPIDTSTTFWYSVAYIYQVLFTVNFAAMQSLMDSIFYLMSSSVKVRLTRLIRLLDADSKTRVRKENLRQELKAYIIAYNRCILDTKTVGNVTGNIYLLQTAQTMFTACVFNYAMVDTSSMGDRTRLIAGALIAFFQLFLFCYAGQTVSNLESTQFEDVHCKFFWWIADRDLNNELFKSIVVTQTVSGPSKTIQSVLIPMSYESYGVVIQQTVSYFMFLRTVFNTNITKE